MGILRLWLALLVYFEHLGGFGLSHLLTGTMAVKSFFIISGFLIQFVLLQKYQSATRFWKSRFMRIYPLYWMVLLGSVIFLMVTNESPRLYRVLPADNGMTYAQLHHKLIFNHADLFAKVWYVVSHILIFGFDLSQYLVYNLKLEKFTLLGDSPYVDYLFGRNFLLIPQAWTIAIELWFYILAPFILLRNTFYLIMMAIVVSYLRNSIHFYSDLYATDIFLELYFFIAGALSCRFYVKFLLNSSAKFYPLAVFLLFGLFIFTLNYQSITLFCKEELFYGIFACSLPFLFCCFRDNKIDRFLGDLSYPIYLVHFLASGLAVAWFNEYHKPFATLLLTVAFAVFAVFTVERPFDRLRYRWFKPGKSTYLLAG